MTSMQNCEPAKTVIFVSGRRPEKAFEQEMNTRGVRVLWADTIKAAAGFLNSEPEKTLVVTELAVVDGNWRDLVERVGHLGRPIPIVLLAPTRTAELWWDALECGVEDIVVGHLSPPRFLELLQRNFTVQE